MPRPELKVKSGIIADSPFATGALTTRREMPVRDTGIRRGRASYLDPAILASILKEDQHLRDLIAAGTAEQR